MNYIATITNTDNGYSMNTDSKSYPDMAQFWDTLREYAMLANRTVTVSIDKS